MQVMGDKGVDCRKPTRNDYLVLTELYNGRTNELMAYTKKYIIEKTKLSKNKVSVALEYFINVGYVSEGVKNRNAKTYFITNEGIKKIEEITKEVL